MVIAALACLWVTACSAQMGEDGLTEDERAMVYGRTGYDRVLAPELPENQETVERLYSPRCSSRGMPLVNGSMASVIFFLSLATVCVSIFAVLYNCCFNSFKNSVINSRW